MESSPQSRRGWGVITCNWLYKKTFYLYICQTFFPVPWDGGVRKNLRPHIKKDLNSTAVCRILWPQDQEYWSRPWCMKFSRTKKRAYLWKVQHRLWQKYLSFPVWRKCITVFQNFPTVTEKYKWRNFLLIAMCQGTLHHSQMDRSSCSASIRESVATALPAGDELTEAFS